MKSFEFASVALDTAALARSLHDVTCGGYAAFEGWVRNHNEGHRVTRLEYEAFEALAIKEGERIVDEARRKFGIDNARCVHRVGSLELCDIAVWVGVSAPHRDEAFRACRYIIDEVKRRVPIWKKEHYENGDSGWVNCERCTAATSESHAHNDRAGQSHAHSAHGHSHDYHHHETPRLTPDYSRQMTLREVGAVGQAKLRASAVLVVGAGGLGVPVLQYLAGAGVGRLGIVDHDRLEPSNLHRQTWYALADCGEPKAELAAARVRALNPDVVVDVHAVRLTHENATQLAASYDLIVDCTDNFTTKFLLNDLAQQLGKPVLFASVYQFEGQLQLVRGTPDGACLRCVWPEATRDGLVGNCVEAGVLGPVPGVLGSLQALEALKILLGLDSQLGNDVLIFDLATLVTNRLRVRRAPACVSGPCQRVQMAATSAAADLELHFDSLDAARAAGFIIVDIREPAEIMRQPTIGPTLTIPMAQLVSGTAHLEPQGRYLLICARGSRSLATAQTLAARGLATVRSLRGGVDHLTTVA